MMMFQITESKSSTDAAWAPEQFDTFFKEIGQKLRGCRPKNDFGWGLLTPPIFIKLEYLSFCISYFSDFGVYFYVNELQEVISAS